jgi:putative ABC transport system permease protein
MPFIEKGRSLLRNLFSPRRVDSDLDSEVRSHLEMIAEEKLRAGMSPEEAQRTAHIELGGVEQVKEQVRYQRFGNWMYSVFSDCRFALRQLGNSPGFALVAVLTLALGIGATTSIFTVINSLLLRPLPYPDSQRIVQLDLQYKNGVYYGMSFIQFRTYQRQNRTMQYLAAYDMIGSGLILSGGTDPEFIHSRRVTADFFRTLGIAPVLGRDFTPDDDRPGAAPVAILSYRVWQDFLGGSPAAIGLPVRLGGELHTIIGVTPRDFAFSRETEAWVPIRTASDPNDHSSPYRVIGRLLPGVTFSMASRDVNAINPIIRQEYPGVIQPNETATLVTSYQDRVVGGVRPLLLLLGGAVACVLLIACSNIASLLLARAVNRRKEMAIRSALGVTQSRLIRQMLTESALLSLGGGALGLLLARGGVRLFLAICSANIPAESNVAVDLHVLWFALGVSLLTGLLFGSAPAWQLGRVNTADALRESGRSTASASTRRIQGFLVSLEICLATVLLLGCSLLLTSLSRLLHVNPGIDPRHVLTLQASLVGPAFETSDRVETSVRKTTDRIQSMPGVEAASASTLIPTEASLQNKLELPFLPEAQKLPPNTIAQWRAIGPAYFNVLRMPMLEGRSFSDSDGHDSAPVAIVNEAFVQTFFSQQKMDAIGQQVLMGRENGPRFLDRARQIVGVIASARELGLDQPPSPAVYIPLGQVPDGMMSILNRVMPINWLIRVNGEPLAFAAAIHREFLRVDPDLVTSNPRPLSQVLSASLSQQQTETALLGFFSTTALLLGVLGLYGVLSYSVAQRKQEIGIRVALGAGRGKILTLVISHGLKLTLSGIVTGLLLGAFLSRFLHSLVFGISPTDPFTYAAVAFLLTLVALAACSIPARRAASIDPVITLRYE